MKAVWVNEGQPLDIDKCRRHEVTRTLFSLRRHTKADVDGARAAGFEVGGYHAHTWADEDKPGITGREYADLVNRLTMTMLGGDGRGIGVQFEVQVDIEKHLPDSWMLEFLRRWRAVRPSRDTSWAFEGFQGPRIAGLRQAVQDARVWLAPYLYGEVLGQDQDGYTRYQAFSERAVILDLVSTPAAFPANIVRPFFDGRLNQRRADGYIFTQARLP